MNISLADWWRRCGFAGSVGAAITLAVANHSAIATEQHACWEQVGRYLQKYGLNIDKMKDFQW